MLWGYTSKPVLLKNNCMLTKLWESATLMAEDVRVTILYECNAGALSQHLRGELQNRFGRHIRTNGIDELRHLYLLVETRYSVGKLYPKAQGRISTLF